MIPSVPKKKPTPRLNPRLFEVLPPLQRELGPHALGGARQGPGTPEVFAILEAGVERPGSSQGPAEITKKNIEPTNRGIGYEMERNIVGIEWNINI